MPRHVARFRLYSRSLNHLYSSREVFPLICRGTCPKTNPIYREFGPKCASCDRIIQATDWVRRARNYVYHLACFACNQCRRYALSPGFWIDFHWFRQLSTGEEYALQEGKLLCKQHFVELVEGESGISNHKAKTKRVRTTFAEEQLSVLQV